jgi:hypothetical protein
MDYVYWVIEGRLAGRPGPNLRPWDPRELYAGGIRAVVSLAEEEPVPDLAPYGITHYRARFPPVDLFSPGMRRAFIYQALPIWAFIDEQVTSGSPALVHCHAGKDRTGSILAGYLICYQGASPKDALLTLRAAHPGAMSARGYADVLTMLSPSTLPDPRTLL